MTWEKYVKAYAEEYYNLGYDEDLYKKQPKKITADSKGGIDNLSDKELRNYVRGFFVNAQEAILNDPKLSENFMSYIGDPNAIFGKDLESLSDEEIKNLAINIDNF
jgi:hypothetical protein